MILSLSTAFTVRDAAADLPGAYVLRPIGPTDPTLTHTLGAPLDFGSGPHLNASGQVAASAFTVGDYDDPHVAWFDDGRGNLRYPLGLAGPGFVDPATGVNRTNAIGLDDAGHVVGLTEAWGSFGQRWFRAWRDNGDGAVEIGPTDWMGIDLTAPGWSSTPTSILPDGTALGVTGPQAYAYGGIAWVHTPQTGTRVVGPTGPGFDPPSIGLLNTRIDVGLTRAVGDRLIGTAPAWDPDTGASLPSVIWSEDLRTGQVLLYAGPSDPRTRYTSARAANAAGQIAGTSSIAISATRTGRQAWIDDGDPATEPILVGHDLGTWSNYTLNDVEAINDDGLTIGRTSFWGGTGLRPDFIRSESWFDDGNSDTGPIPLAFPDAEPGAFHYGRQLNNAGLVYGESSRSLNTSPATYREWHWLYDTQDDAYTEIPLPEDASLVAATLRDDGSLFGLSFRPDVAFYVPFFWRVDTGWIDLADRVLNPEALGVDAALADSWSVEFNAAGDAVFTEQLADPGPENDYTGVQRVWLLDAIAVAQAGDFTGDGTVDQADLNLVLNGWGLPRGQRSGPWFNAGSFGTDAIDQEELNAVLNHWGDAASPDLRGAPVPEPVALGWAALAFAGLGRRGTADRSRR